MTEPKKTKRSWKPPQLTFLESTGTKTALLFCVLGALGIWIAVADLQPDLSHVDNSMLSGSETGNYYRIVDRLGGRTKAGKGTLNNVTSSGSVENLKRLAAEADSCKIQFAMVQDGLDWSASDKLTLLGRLWKAETVFFLGRDVDKVEGFRGLKGKTIGIGPEGSGTARIARQILGARDFSGLNVTLKPYPLAEQLDLLEKGALDFGVFVIDEDATLIDEAIRKRGLQIVNFPRADVVARRLPFVRTGRIGAGQYDAMELLPKQDKKVLRVGTLVLSNGCADRSQTLGLLATLAEEFPDFLRHNKTTPNATGLELASEAKAFFDGDGVDVVDAYFPWIGDVMPPSNWVHIIMGVSILFNLMGLWNRFRVWRTDANRVNAERYIPLIFGPGHNNDTISLVEPTEAHRTPEKREQLDTLISELQKLLERCKKQSLSILVPMAGELVYRYQEDILEKTLLQLHEFRTKLG